MATYGYIRVSTAEQAEGTSLEDQKRRIGGLALAADLTLDLCFRGRRRIRVRPVGRPAVGGPAFDA